MKAPDRGPDRATSLEHTVPPESQLPGGASVSTRSRVAHAVAARERELKESAQLEVEVETKLEVEVSF